MLHQTKSLKNFTLGALDGEIGKVKELYFDDLHWTVRYIIADTGSWIVERQVLISPYAMVNVDTEHKIINTNLTKLQIEKSPSISTDKPVSRQFEEDYYAFYGWPMYWSGSFPWGESPDIAPFLIGDNELSPSHKVWDPHLRSTHEISGYHIHAQDGEIGHIVDFIIDDRTWTIRYLIVDTQNWWPGEMVVINTNWIESINWGENKISLNLSREAIKRSPTFHAKALLTREYENLLHTHYDRRGYWEEDSFYPTAKHPHILY